MQPYLLMDKQVQEKLIPLVAMILKKKKGYCQDHLNVYFNKFNKNKEVQMCSLKLFVHF